LINYDTFIHIEKLYGVIIKIISSGMSITSSMPDQRIIYW